MSYGIPQRATLIALMALNREVANSELEKHYGIRLPAPQRRTLVEDGLIEVQKLPTEALPGLRGNALSLTDSGWAWVIEELDQPPPPRAGSAGGALYALLNGLKAVLDARSQLLQELFLPVVDAPPGDGGGEAPSSSAGTDGEPGEPLALRIPAAIRRLANRPGDWVELAALRAEFRDIARDAFDAALRDLALAQRIRATRHEDTARITPDVAAAALRLGGRDQHLVSVES